MSDYQSGYGLSLVANLAVATARAGGAVVTGSGALLAGAVQAAGDGVALAVLAASRRRGLGGRGLHSARHPLAQERQRNFWPLALGALLAGMGGALVTYIAAARLVHPSSFAGAYGRVVVGIAVATTLWMAAPLVKASWWHALGQLHRPRRPEVALVTLQEALSVASGVGVTVAVTGTAVTGNPVFDTLGMVAAGVMMVTAAVLQLILMRRTVVGRGASRVEQQGIAAAIEVEPSVVRLAHLDSYHVSPDELLVAVKVDLVTGLELGEVSETVERLKASIRRAVPAVCVLYLEPGTSAALRIDDDAVPVTVHPEIRPAGSDFERRPVIIAREATSNHTYQEGKPWQSA